MLSFPLLSSIGLYAISKKLSARIVSTILFVQLVLFMVFVNHYFFSMPVAEEDNFVVGERVAVGYLNRSNAAILATLKPDIIRKTLAFFSEDMSWLNDNNEVNVFTSICPDPNTPATYIVESKLDCKGLSEDYIAIQSQRDSGAMYKIYNDHLCSGVELTPFRRTHKISDYNIEKLSDEEFCNRWVFKY